MKSNFYKVGLVSLLLLLPLILSQATFNLPQQGRLAGNFYVHNHKFDYPVAEESCVGIASSESYGFFWDGQKCEKCTQLECLCDANNPCRKCIDGWVLINNRCVQCLQFNADFEYFNKEDDTPEEFDQFALRNDGVKQVLHKSREDVMVQCCNPFTNLNIIDWQTQWNQGLRATQCIQPQKPGFDPVYVLMGSFCWYMQGCQEYKPNGKCLICQDGYFVDDNQICRECMYQAKGESKIFNEVFPQLGSSIAYTQRVCSKCRANNQCDKCVDGFYLYTAIQFNNEQNQSTDGSFFKNNGEDVLKSASWCKKCTSNCACSVDQNNKEINQKPIDNSWYKKGNTCFTCDSNNNNKFCNTCNYNEQLDKFQCLSCKSFTGTTFQYTAITYQPSSNGDCVQCKDGCYYCRFSDITTSADTTCEVGGITYCKNGYYAQKTAAGIVVCGKCTDTQANQNNNRLFARCKTNTVSDSNVIVTQCITDAGVDDSKKYENLEHVVGYHNMQPPSVKDYYMIQTIDKRICVQNVNNCKKMIDQNALCASCYEELGWFNVQNICRQCTISGCAKCKLNAAGTGLACDVCSSSSLVQTIKSADELQCNSCTTTINPNCATCKLSGVSAETVCLTCRDGFFFNSTATPAICVPCAVKNCKDCKANVTLCNSCQDYYRIWKGTNLELRSNQLCEACEWGCKTCEVRKVCTQCADMVGDIKLYLWEGQCHSYKANCLLMSTQGKCDICKTGFRLVDQRCLRCLDLTGGFVHCALGCDVSSLRWYTNIDAEFWITK